MQDLPSKRPALVIQVFHPNLIEYNTPEILGLLSTAGYTNTAVITQNLSKINPKFFLGKGKVDLVEDALDTHFNYGNKEKTLSPQIDDFPSEEPWNQASNESQDAEMEENSLHQDIFIDLNLPDSLRTRRDLTVIFNNRLSYMQMLNLGRVWDTKVIDRDELVLEIFEKHARTRESKLQIELARLTLQTNIVKKEMGTHLQEKQGRGFMGKGLAAWEPKMRAFRGKRKKIQDELNRISQGRHLRRKSRSKFFNCGIIGYTNAGKSTLLNSLAKTKLETANQEFTTVGTTSRKVTFPKFDKYGQWCGEEVIISDSVGFISDMSNLLIDAFLSTLEELQFANLLIIVLDLAEAKFSRILTKINATFAIIDKLKIGKIPALFVFNKVDLISSEIMEERTNRIHQMYPDIPHVQISALEKSGLKALAEYILSFKHEKFNKYAKTV